MFKNYLVIAYRNFRKNKIFSLINIFGLSVGISAALVIFLIVYFEFSYDHVEKDGDRIYRVVLDANFGGVPGHSSAVPAPMADAIRNEITGIEATVPYFNFPGDGTPTVTVSGNPLTGEVDFKHQKDIVFTNPEYFQVLPYHWLTGSPVHSIENAFTVVLAESRAQQYFPGIPLNEMIGKQISYNKDLHLTVSGIVRDLGENNSFAAKEFISYATILHTDLRNQLMMTTWNDWMAYTHILVKLAPGSSKPAAEQLLKKLYNKYNPKNGEDPETAIRFVLQPLQDIHFNSDYAGFGQRLANYSTMYSLLSIAAFLLILACINFINLSTAQAAHRAKEIGIRKTLGSSRKRLMIQFLSETFFITMMATVVSVILTPFLLKAFSSFIPEGLELNLIHQPYIILFLLGLTLLVSFLAGLYPAIVLSGFNPVKSLKNQGYTNSGQSKSAWVRKTLTVSQFVVAQFFIIGTLIVSKQLHFSMNQDLGFRKDAIINFDIPFDTATSKTEKLLNELHAIPEIEMVSSGFFSPASEGAAFTNIKYAGKENLKDQVQLRWGDSNYIKLYQIKILAGRNIQKTERFQEFLINETYAKELGFAVPEDALNKMLIFNGKKLPIVGVMKDFHQQSTHTPIGPLVFTGGKGSTFHILLKPKGAGGMIWKTAIEKIQNSFHTLYPQEEFSYSFVDDNLARLYQNEQNISQLLYWATGLTITISCLGLLGMVIFVTNTRMKEIGVRKVLGAPVAHIVYILSKDFVTLVLAGFVISAPIAWWAAYQWLAGFAYRTTISWWIFIACAVMILIFALITLSVQTLRAAMANPVKSLRTD